MSKFTLVKKLGLTVYAQTDIGVVVYAEDLESILQSAQVVYGTNEYRPDEYEWSKNKLDSDTHCALLLAITPIKKQTKAEAALELLERLAKDPAYYSGLGTSAARAILEMKDEV